MILERVMTWVVATGLRIAVAEATPTFGVVSSKLLDH